MAKKTDSATDHPGLSSFRARRMSRARRRSPLGMDSPMDDRHSSNARSASFGETSDPDCDPDSSTTGQCAPRTPECSFGERLPASSPSHDHRTSQAQDSSLDANSSTDSFESCPQWPPQTPGCSFEESLPASSPAHHHHHHHHTPQARDPSLDNKPPSHSTKNCPQWPPHGLEKRSMLTPQDAERLICKGVSLVEGVLSLAPHTASRYIRYNGTANIGDGKTIRGAYSKDVRFRDSMALALNTAVECTSPWEVLERPVVALPFGRQPSTITLDHWVSLKCYPVETADSADSASRVQPRKMEFYDILNRLDLLQHDEIDEDATLREHSLYTVLVHDLDKKVDQYEMDIEKEIATLIDVLNLPIWFDFTKAEAQLIVTYYENQDPETASFFFQQLLLSMELFLRIREEIYDEKQKVQILARLPPRVAWTVAMAQIWTSKVVIERFEEGNSVLPFRVRVRDTEVPKEELINFGYLLKWPNTVAVALALEKTGNDVMSAEDTHPAVMSYLSGVVFPGVSASWLMMQCLVDCDGDAREKLMGVNALHPNFGFQYRGATYWYWQCIIGKVLGAAKGVSQAAGWVGPCHHTDDLERTQAILVRQMHTSPPLGQRQVKSMALRSDPLGPVDDTYPVGEYELALPTTMSDVADTIRIQKLAFKVFQRANTEGTSEDLTTYRSAVIFAINGRSRPIPLAYDVSFISAAPCTQGPHVLFYDYEYLSVRIDGLLLLDHQGLFDAKKRRSPKSVDSEKVIVVEAFGVADNQVLARSWCSQHGFSAVVADINDTCMACSIRQAYALCVSVVILTCGQGDENVEAVKAVNRSPPICQHRDRKRSAP